MKVFKSSVVALLLLAGACSTHHEAGPVDPANYQHKVRVACVGDSITAGVGAAHGFAYPSQLQAMLGEQWEVKNFGVSGRTLLKDGDFPYWREKAFQAAQDYNPDVVLIMLGTNDTKPQNWILIDAFQDDYKELIGTFTALPSRPRIYLCRPCPVRANGSWGINETNLQKEMPWIDAVAKSCHAGIIDMHAAVPADPELLPDKVHPSTEGARLMAAAAFHKLTGY
ncbi:MAG TPA: GDSL-type esterase/lipase family protein [Verrucomicrobiae bacterium]